MKIISGPVFMMRCAALLATALRFGSPATFLVLIAAVSSAAHAAAANDGSLDGVVSGPNGPEAGVWVIAETDDLPTKYVKIVVTGDDGRYVMPELPDAEYDVWVRGYGLVD